ncbi:MAG TPA: 5'-nucleotidase C-terminal domain-containing protein [Gemmatimonadales bacterium]|jgi:2',3'-cyclic-nucleotide 2'-phosphodiesterase/3'-nucleotidase/5'-nucleotidase|nr:5'-nucleotidase C-terminal domain-containing protein [Gemmatimonadales bacterium]
MLLLLAALALAAPAQDTAHVVLVATTDVHGHATEWDYARRQPFAGGLARVATVVDSLRADYPGEVVVMDAGDLLQGDAFATYFARVKPHDPHPLIEAMNLTGYDVATPGNHEFDWGLGPMRQAITGAAFPYVSGNIYTLAGDTLLYPPYVVLQRQGVRIGVAGFTTPGALVWDRVQLQGKVRIDRIPAAASRVMEAMRRETDVAVALVHSGMDGPASYDTTGIGGEHAAASLATLLVRPDVVVVGHSHREMRDSVIGGVHFVQPRPFGGGVSIIHLDLTRQDDRWRLTRVRSELISTARVAPSARVTQRLARAHAAVLSWVETPLGTATGSMRAHAARVEPTPILGFVNAVQRMRTGADLSAASAFDLEAGFDSGSIRLGQVVALYPYDNTLRAVRVTGAQLKAYLEHSARYFRADPVDRISINDSVPGYNYDVIAGARYEIDLRRRVGDRIRNLAVGGRRVRPADRFTLALNSYRQTGAGGYTMLRDAPVVYDKGENIRDLLIEEIRSRGEIDPADYAGRDWRIVPQATAAAVRALFRVPDKPLPAGARDTIILRVLATADLHGGLLPKAGPDGKPAGGVAALAALMDSLAADCDCPTLRLDAGDAMQGTVVSNVTRGRAMVEVLNRLNLTAGALGEHDFEWSLDTLRRRISEARYPWLAANVFDSASGRRPDWIAPYRMVPAGSLKVAVVGYITSDAKTSVKPELTGGLRFGDGALAIHDVLAEVRSQRPDLTILLAHAGASCDGPVCTGEAIRIAEGAESRTIDLLVAGHSHQVVNTRVAGVPIVEAGSDGAALAIADLVKTVAGGREVRTRVAPVIPDSVTANAAMVALVETYRRKADSLTSRVVAAVKLPLARSDGQSRLGSLIAEARRNVLRTDVGLVGNAGIRADLPAGPVTYGQLFEIQPSQNRLVRLTLSGARLREVLEHAIDRGGRPTAHVAGVKVRFDPRARKRRIQSVELLGDRKLRADATYTLAVDDFLSGGGDGYTMLVGLPAEPAGMLDIEGLITYLRRLPQPVTFQDEAGFRSTRR